MEALFLQILNMSVSASWLILAVIGVRMLMKKVNAPKNLRYVLWMLVAVRLLCPYTIESAMSLLPRQDVLPMELQVSEENRVDSLIDVKEEETISYENIYEIEEIISNADETGPIQNTDTNSAENVKWNWPVVLSIIWEVGVFAFLGYGVVSYVKLSKKVSASIYTEPGVWICDEIHSPFILGIRRPRIYMPSDIEEVCIPYILAHEKEHMKCLDHLWKPLGFFLLSLHWFNPLVWIAYVLMCKDIEYACDERVIRFMDREQKKQYTQSLLFCSSPRHYITACPVAFGENSIKERIKNVISYKKPAVWILGLGIVACIIVAICFTTSPPTEKGDTTPNTDSSGLDSNYGVLENGTAGIPGDDVNLETTYVPSVANKVLFETTADLDHDGVEDLVQTMLIYNPQEAVAKDDPTHPANSVLIKIYLGTKDGGYQPEAAVTTGIVSMSHAANGTYVLTKKDGLDYLIFSNMYENQENASYEYQILYVKKDKFVVKAEDSIDFICNPWRLHLDESTKREDVVPAFRDGLEDWLDDTSMILVSFDVMEEPYYTAGDAIIPASMYYENVWNRKEAQVEEWQQYMYAEFGTTDGIYWIQEQLESDLSEWYTAYDGSKLQRIIGTDPYQASCGPSVNDDIIYYEADANEDIQDVVYKMFESMLVVRMEPEEGRYYTITDYVISQSPILPIAENMWLIKYLRGYYKYEGTDLVSYEEAVKYYEEEDIVDGCIPILMQGSDSNFWYLLIEKDGVYRMQRYGNMVPEGY